MRALGDDVCAIDEAEEEAAPACVAVQRPDTLILANGERFNLEDLDDETYTELVCLTVAFFFLLLVFIWQTTRFLTGM